jgi:uncharacterized membrane protein YcaP (DUF421 family)
MFFHSWAGIGRVMLSSVIVFVIVVALLRAIGQQALAKMSGFDVVFAVTLGSVVGSVVVTRDVPIAEAVAALVTLLGVQELTRFVQSRSLRAHHAVRQPPRVMLWNGELLEDRLRASSVSADEIRAAVRRAGLRSLSDARVVVLENDGDWSVVAKREGESDESAFFGLPIPGRSQNGPNDGADSGEPVGPHRLP